MEASTLVGIMEVPLADAALTKYDIWVDCLCEAQDYGRVADRRVEAGSVREYPEVDVGMFCRFDQSLQLTTHDLGVAGLSAKDRFIDEHSHSSGFSLSSSRSWHFIQTATRRLASSGGMVRS
jgi:hypothetical protein